MKKLIIDEELFLTDMELTYKGKALKLKRVLVEPKENLLPDILI